MPEWFTAWAETVSLFDAILWLAAVVAVFLFVKRGWPAVKKFANALFAFVKIVDSVAGLPAFIERTDDTLAEQTETLAVQGDTLEAQDVKIQEIHHELSWNQESSVKDAVRRVEMGIKGLYDEVDKLHAADDLMAADIEHTQPRSKFAPPQE